MLSLIDVFPMLFIAGISLQVFAGCRAAAAYSSVLCCAWRARGVIGYTELVPWPLIDRKYGAFSALPAAASCGMVSIFQEFG
jgi:hypothetical protein